MRRRALVMVMLASTIGARLGAQDKVPPQPPYFEFQVERPVVLMSGGAPYPAMLKSAGVEGEVLAQFVVDDSGRYEALSFRVLKSSHELFTQSVRMALPSMRFAPAMLGGRQVRQLVQQPFVFSLGPTSPDRVVALRPAEVRFGSTLTAMQQALASRCTSVRTRRIDPPFRVLRDIKDKQFQIDCEGFEYQGKPRHAEFIVADDALEMVWIMTDRPETAALFQRMEREYGAPDATNAKFYAFTRARAALRVDVAEVLFYSERMVPRIAEWFAPNSTF